MALSQENHTPKEHSERLVSPSGASIENPELENLLNLLLGIDLTDTQVEKAQPTEFKESPLKAESPIAEDFNTPAPTESQTDSEDVVTTQTAQGESVYHNPTEPVSKEQSVSPSLAQNTIPKQPELSSSQQEEFDFIDYQPDFSALDAILERWEERKKEQQSESELPTIETEIDVQSAEFLRIIPTLLEGEENHRDKISKTGNESQETAIVYAGKLTEENEAVSALQQLLFGSQMSEIEELKQLIAETGLTGMRQMIEVLYDKIKALEIKLSDSKELTHLLVPCIGEILSLKIRTSKEEIVKVLVPIIDQVIRQKTNLDHVAMSAAIAELLPSAIAQEIKSSPKEIAKAIAPEIGEAIRQQISIDRDEIIRSIAPEMGRAISAQIEIEKDAMVDALYPVIGNTITKYLAEAIKTINEKVENAFSPEGVSRKIRATLQGVSEAELILKEAMPFQVEAIFLIHKASGLVICEVQESSQQLESEMIAGMLTAIRSFVNDCIVKVGNMSELNQIEYGNSKIILEVAGYCYIAVVEKGEVSKKFITEMRDVLSRIVLKHGQLIEAYDGDPSKIPPIIQEWLESLMNIVNVKDKKGKSPKTLMALSVGLLAAIFIPWGIHQYQTTIERKQETVTATALAATPQLAVYRLNVDAKGKTLTLSGNLPNEEMRKLAGQVALKSAGNWQLKNNIQAVEIPPDPVLIAAEVQRLVAVFNDMDGIDISAVIDGEKINIAGTVMQLSDAKKIAASFGEIPGVKAVVSAVKLNPLTINSRIYFESASAFLDPSYDKTLQEIKEFLNQYPQKYLKIIGHSDRTGNQKANQNIAMQRAKVVQQALIKKGVNPSRLQIVANGNPPADVSANQPLLLSRCVVFEPILKSK